METYKEVPFYVATIHGKPHPYPKEYLDSVELDTDEKLAAVFPEGGKWHTMFLVDPFRMEHEERHEKAMQEREELTGILRRNGARFNGTLVEIAVSDWSLDFSHTEEGFRRMPRTLGRPLADLIVAHCYGDALDSPFFKYLSDRQGATAAAATTKSP